MTSSYGTCTHMVSCPVTVAWVQFQAAQLPAGSHQTHLLNLPSDMHAVLCALQPPEMMTEGQLTPATDVW